MIYFTSDTHFGHKNIIEYCARPFASTHEMNLHLIERWNDTVAPIDPEKPETGDAVFHLGDFSMSGKYWEEVWPLLNGYKSIIKGNHDKEKFWKNFAQHPLTGFYNIGGEEIEVIGQEGVTITSGNYGVKVYCNHYPLFAEPDRPGLVKDGGGWKKEWLQAYEECDIFLYGHVHDKVPEGAPEKAICVCTELTNYSPISLDEVVKIWKERTGKE